MEPHHHETSLFVLIVGAFFFFSGLYSIVISLNTLGQHKADSTIETKLFKFNAPVGFTYGIAALLSVVGLVYLDRFQEQSEEINELNKRISQMREENHLLRSSIGDSTRIIKDSYSYDEPQSIFNGKVVLDIERFSSADRAINFTGTKGISIKPFGAFSRGNKVRTDTRRLYILLDDSTVWGMNILGEPYNSSQLNLEFYRVGALKTHDAKAQ
jgi:hypothetical protein